MTRRRGPFKKTGSRPMRGAMIDFRAGTATGHPGDACPLRGLLDPWTAGGGQFLRGDLATVLARLCRDERGPRPLVIAAGAAPALVEAACSLDGLRVTLVPPDRDGLPDRPSLFLALERAGAGCRCLLPLASPLGVLADPPLLEDVARALPGGLLLDVGFALYEPALELSIPWPGTAALLGPERPFEPLGDAPWLAVEVAPEAPPPAPAAAPEGAETVLAWDEWIRSALEARDGIVTWPRARETYAPGIVAFSFEGWPAGEAAAILEESFGILVDAARPTAAPLPGDPAEVLRVFPGPGHHEAEIEALVGALWRVAESRRPDPVAH